MPFGFLEGIGMGCKVTVIEDEPVVYPGGGWLGRVINAMGEPIDGKGPLPRGARGYPLRAQPPPAHTRQRVTNRPAAVDTINAGICVTKPSPTVKLMYASAADAMFMSC